MISKYAISVIPLVIVALGFGLRYLLFNTKCLDKQVSELMSTDVGEVIRVFIARFWIAFVSWIVGTFSSALLITLGINNYLSLAIGAAIMISFLFVSGITRTK